MHNPNKWLILILAALLSTALGACAEAAPAPTVTAAAHAATIPPTSEIQDVTTADEKENMTVDSADQSDALSASPTGELSTDEVAGLLFMREEEKLAHDVYLTLYEKWGLPIFQNIANSEQTHTEAVQTLLDRYDLDDPAAGKGAGVFADATLQSLYDQLVAQGSQSLADALKVGAVIEEIDILDLEERVVQTDRADIQRVYENLMKGSRNHLRSFTSMLERQAGETYQPQYLTQAAYDAIVDTPAERGRRSGS